MTHYSTSHLVKIRDAEFNLVKKYFQPGLRVLEIGGGNGFQASRMHELGCIVTSIDVTETPTTNEVFFPVQVYDGKVIPFSNAAFDIVFTCNVLEHITELGLALSEIKRVAKANGIIIHLVPSASWRLFTTLTHYVYLAKRLLTTKAGVPGGETASAAADKLRKRGLFAAFRGLIFAGPHGEYPGAVSELWYFSRVRWRQVFRKHDYVIDHASGNGIFYTGYGIAPALSLKYRRLLSIFGSACHVFVLRPGRRF